MKEVVERPQAEQAKQSLVATLNQLGALETADEAIVQAVLFGDSDIAMSIATLIASNGDVVGEKLYHDQLATLRAHHHGTYLEATALTWGPQHPTPTRTEVSVAIHRRRYKLLGWDEAIELSMRGGGLSPANRVRVTHNSRPMTTAFDTIVDRTPEQLVSGNSARLSRQSRILEFCQGLTQISLGLLLATGAELEVTEPEHPPKQLIKLTMPPYTHQPVPQLAPQRYAPTTFQCL